jgi:hypothetical protein
LLEETGRRARTHDVVYDDTPIALHAADVADSLKRAGGAQRFEEIFEGRTKAELIGLFLALLELIRQKRVRIEQERIFGPIIIHLLDESPIEDDLAVLEDSPADGTIAASETVGDTKDMEAAAGDDATAADAEPEHEPAAHSTPLPHEMEPPHDPQ